MNYIKSQFFRIFNSKTFYMLIMFTLIAIALTVAYFSKNKITPIGTNNIGVIRFAFTMWPLILVFISYFIVNIFDNEYHNKTVKNSVSSGISRFHIYFGKLISMHIISIMFIILSFVAIILFSAIAKVPSRDMSPALISNTLKSCLVCFPLIISALSLGAFLSTLFRTPSLFVVVYSFTFIFGFKVLEKLITLIMPSLKWILKYTLTYNFYSICDLTPTFSKTLHILLTSGIYIALFSALGYYIFNKLDIN